MNSFSINYLLFVVERLWTIPPFVEKKNNYFKLTFNLAEKIKLKNRITNN